MTLFNTDVSNEEQNIIQTMNYKHFTKWLLGNSNIYHIWAISWDYGTFHPPLTHSSTAHAQPSSGARRLLFGRDGIFYFAADLGTKISSIKLIG